MAVVIVVSFINALFWINKPFPGFLIYDFPNAGSMNMKDWSGRNAGVKFLERLVTVDGQDVWSGEEVVEMVRRKPPGDTVRYVFEGKEDLHTIDLPVGMFSARDFFMVFFLTYLGGVVVFGLGFVVFLLKPNVTNSWVFFMLAFFLGLYMITAFEIQSTYMFVEFHYLSLCLGSALFFHLGTIFPEKKRIIIKYPFLEYIIYIPAVIIAAGYQIYIFGSEEILSTGAYSWLPVYKSMSKANRLFQLFCIACLMLFVLHAVFRATSTNARKRARMILFGVSIAFVPPAAIMMLANFFKVSFPWNFLVFFVIFFPAAISYSITRHNLFDADIIIRRTVGYFAVTAVIIGAYLALSVGLNVVMGKYQAAQSQAFPILFTVGVILVFNPLRDRIQRVVDRVFFRKEYDYGEIIEKVGNAMTTMLELPPILKRLTNTFINDMFIDTGSVVLLGADGTEFKVGMSEGEKSDLLDKVVIKRDDPLIGIMEDRPHVLTRYDLIEDPKYKEVSKGCVTHLDALNASMLLPLVFQDKLIGLLSLGEKKSGKTYNSEDIELLRTLASQGAVAIENARLFQENLEKQRMEEELNIARDLQMSMLPASCPEFAGYQIAAFSEAAREVGGDFYDFVETKGGGLGFIIGDVTGKSVSGALVMSASRSIFRMLSEEDLSVSEIMIRANRRSKKDIKPGMFVALLYAVLNPESKTLSLCSAGQTQPVYISAKAKSAQLIETIGDTFPLGILDDVEYEETQIDISSGDKVIFYTDGIVEAMNMENEMFGFDRLLEVAKENWNQPADTMLKEIIDKVNEFSNGMAQHDDLTAIVVSMNAETS